MPLDKDRAQAINAAITSIERQFGKGSIMRLGEADRPVIQAISWEAAARIAAAMDAGGHLHQLRRDGAL